MRCGGGYIHPVDYPILAARGWRLRRPCQWGKGPQPQVTILTPETQVDMVQGRGGGNEHIHRCVRVQHQDNGQDDQDGPGDKNAVGESGLYLVVQLPLGTDGKIRAGVVPNAGGKPGFGAGKRKLPRFSGRNPAGRPPVEQDFYRELFIHQLGLAPDVDDR